MFFSYYISDVSALDILLKDYKNNENAIITLNDNLFHTGNFLNKFFFQQFSPIEDIL